jgi:hypothetical protein
MWRYIYLVLVVLWENTGTIGRMRTDAAGSECRRTRVWWRLWILWWWWWSVSRRCWVKCSNWEISPCGEDDGGGLFARWLYLGVQTNGPALWRTAVQLVASLVLRTS